MDLSVDLIQAEEIGDAERTLWRSFVQQDEVYASPFLWPEFSEIAGAVAPGARIAIFHQGGRIVGFFPHQMRGKAAQPLAAPLNDYHGLIMAPGEARPLLSDMPQHLRAESLTVNGWTPADVNGPNRKVLMADLPDGWDAYYEQRRAEHGKFFKDKERARRSLEKDRGGEVWTQVDVRDPALLDELIGWKRDQYQRTRRHDVFACGWTAEVLHALMADPRPGFGACLAVLWAGDRPAGLEFSLYAGDHYHFWFPSYAADAARCSPGVLLSQDTMRLKSPDGFKVFDFGFAGEFYKKYFCNREDWVTEASVFQPGWRQFADRTLDRVSVGPARRLTGSLRRRWAIVEACETTAAGRWKAAAAAAAAGLQRIKSESQSKTA